MTENLLTLQQAADRLGVHYHTARKLVRTGELRASRIGFGPGKHWRVPESAINEYIESTSNQPQPETAG